MKTWSVVHVLLSQACLGNVADERLILFSHCKINFAGVWNVEVRPTISTDPTPKHKLSLLEMAKNNITRSSSTLPRSFTPRQLVLSITKCRIYSLTLSCFNILFNDPQTGHLSGHY